MHTAEITGIGHYVPERVVPNSELMNHMDTTNEWIVERTGIEQRRFFKAGEDTVSNMGAKAAKKALAMAGKEAEDVDMIVFATLTPDYYFPGSGVLLQHQLGLKGRPAIDVRQQCSGFVYGLSIADQYIKTGMSKCVLVVGSEIQSNVMELSDRGRNMAVIFGDGAGAVIVERAAEDSTSQIYSTHLHSDGEYAEELMVKSPSSSLEKRFTPEMIESGEMLPYMNGPLVFKHAVVKFPEVIQEALDHNGMNKEDIDLLVPHQANLRIAQFVQKRLGLPDEKVFNNIQKYGNTTAASIPIAMSEAVEQGKLKKGDLLCVAAFGSGFTWASALIRW